MTSTLNTPAASLVADAVKDYRQKFGAEPAAFGAAPGRIEILGNHTDYNEGFVLSAAIDRYTVVVGGKSPDDKVRLHSSAFANVVEFDINDETKYEGEDSWANYSKGVIVELRKASYGVPAFQASIYSNVPVGAGVSSSAAIELATANLIRELDGPDSKLYKAKLLEVVLACKSAENNFVGMGCGILDQYTSAFAKSGQLVHLDCRDNSCDYVPLQNDVRFVLCNTHAPHQLVDGKYNELRKCCFGAAKALGVPFLRDIDADTYEAKKSTLTEDDRKRANHVIGENTRVAEAMDAISKNDMEKFGQLMNASHVSSRDDFGNSCKELDIMFDQAQGCPGFLGARLMGGGFGGCTINLVKADKVDDFCKEVAQLYEKASGIKCDTIAVAPGDGAHGGKL
ncbi:Galactokinase, putative [Perkinsus marinus ATCC 50983]|uniref:Galactokinase, putative n=1 Tax=Perkinsus marinus (strain ATCC 50983 / TXsc) TaxID=423536 RepID=C5K895_PERM5|nr:Galactokinase, putative [Perkinsus marinus ATCC 50983]EER19283.1 Galactokinase, putative [Perkinsus marinus ATCC 50983]|eukprot:XP_002787487.1 Galactokinase, putative [Perkinsus marinus ATCC 50983]